MHRLLHITLAYASGTVRNKELEPIFTAIGDDWIRYTAQCWILWTNKPAHHVFTLLAAYLESDRDILLISAMNGEDSFGLMPRWAWDWIHSKTGSELDHAEAMKVAALPNALVKRLGLSEP